MDLSAKNQHQQQQRQMNNAKSSSSAAAASSLSKAQQLQQQQVAAQAQLQAFDMLTPFGGDLSSAMAALSAASTMDSSGTFAQLNALAQLNQLAATNPKIAAAAMLQFQQQLANPGASSSSAAQSASMLANSMNSQSPSMLPAQHQHSSMSSGGMVSGSSGNKVNHTRYQQLLSIVDEMGKDIRNTYLGNKNSTERLKRGIASARILVKDCQLECERNTKQ